MPDIERDLERMQLALATGDATEPGLSEVAARYAAACRSVNDRLHRCSMLLRKGFRTESIQEALLAPAVLDQFAILDIPEREQWSIFAKDHGFLVPPPLQVASASDLNQAF